MLSVLVLFALATAPPAAGGPIYVGVSARDPGLDAQAERAAIALGQALEQRGAIDLGSPPLPDAVEGPDAILDGLVSAARSKYLEGDFTAAQSKADEAIVRFEGSGAFRVGPSWRAWADAVVVRALALRRVGKEADADAALEKLAVVRPDAIPDAELTPPKVAQRHLQLLADLRGKPRVQIEITSEPAGAEVVVDGKAVGKAPLVARDLLPGTHFVSLAAQGERIERKVAVTTGAARLEERVGDPRAIAARALRATVSTAASAEAIAGKARIVGDDVIVGALVPHADGAWLVLARVRGDALVVAGAPVDKKTSVKTRADALADALLAGKGVWIGEGVATPEEVLLKGDPATPSVGSGPTPPAEVSEDDGGTWIFVAVGAGAAAAVATAVVVGVIVAGNADKTLEVSVDASKLKPR